MPVRSFSLSPQRLTILLIAALLGACNTAPTIEKDGAGKRIDTSVIPNAKPKSEPITNAGNKSPYQVFGKTYRVLPTSKGYKATGIASWYGTKFHGRLTSNGEVYNMYGMTAAHKSLPIPSYARVTNVENGKSVVVRINDRGPFHGARLIDLSYVAAMKLGYADKGTAKVLIEVIDTAVHPQTLANPPLIAQVIQTAPLKLKPKPKPTRANTAASSGNYLQVGAFSDVALANELKGKIRGLTSKPISVRNQNNLFKLWIGPIANNLELQRIKAMLKNSANLSAFSVSP
jgi:rare lipoprotein A|tara:strand:+ start:10443 stop:11306 length:864 start_codon:yes stop_codon:yes gene_type:complete